MSGRGGKDGGEKETEAEVHCFGDPGFSLLVVAMMLLRRHHLWFSNSPESKQVALVVGCCRQHYFTCV